VPGLSADQIEVAVNAETRVLTVKGERKTEREQKDSGGATYTERSMGKFSRTFRLPSYVDQKCEDVEASLEHGVLTVSLPKAKNTSPPRSIPVGGAVKQAAEEAKKE